jgi:hypothetical protein
VLECFVAFYAIDFGQVRGSLGRVDEFAIDGFQDVANQAERDGFAVGAGFAQPELDLK